MGKYYLLQATRLLKLVSGSVDVLILLHEIKI